MKKDQNKAGSTPGEMTALPRISDYLPISIAKPCQSGEPATGFDLIDRAAELIRESEQRAMQADEKAERVSAKAIEAVKAAQMRVEQTQAQIRLVEQHAAEQAKLTAERMAKVEASAQERIDKAEAWAQEADERARAAESELKAALARASDAEETLDHLNEALRRKLTSVARSCAPAAHNTSLSLN
jgi:predicted S18 family serine protease